jgi:hypothetical protein
MQIEMENLQLKQKIKYLDDHHTSKPLEEMVALYVEMSAIKEKQAEIIHTTAETG